MFALRKGKVELVESLDESVLLSKKITKDKYRHCFLVDALIQVREKIGTARELITEASSFVDVKVQAA